MRVIHLGDDLVVDLSCNRPVAMKTLIPGGIYEDNILVDAVLPPAFDDADENTVEYGKVLFQEIPYLKRIAFDITGSDGDPISQIITFDGWASIFKGDEVGILQNFFALIKNYPILLSFDGDNSGTKYLSKRAELLGIEHPFDKENGAKGIGFISLDIQRFFNNKVIRSSYMKDIYENSSLKELARSILNKEIPDLDEIVYSVQTPKIIFDLISNETMNFIITLMRITRSPMYEIINYWSSVWLEDLLIHETINCNHQACRQNKVPDTDLWVCASFLSSNLCQVPSG